LHQHDNGKLIQSLKNLRDIGNTVLVVEHDRDMIEQADYLLDIGPGAGVHGGNIVFAGNPKDLLSEDGSYNPQFPLSSTARYLSGQDDINVPLKRKQSNGNTISLFNASGNNLKNVDVNIPLGVFTCITGMSGSGKSTLINDTLFPILTRHFYRATTSPLPYGDISGLEHIDKVIEIDQAPIGRTPRSNPVTYTGVFTLIRDFFTQLPESKIRGYKQGRFSFNVPGGRCEECEGAGLKKIEMNYLPDVFVICDICNGKRYNNETLQVTYKGKTIADVLSMTIEESLEFFSELSSIKRKLQALFDVGLGYITLGQQAPTLSGGEAQRVKLATELSKISTGKTLYLLDEPTTGLHFQDITYLLSIIYKLVEKGNTVVVIEHNLDIIKCADWIIDMGPTGGANGGFIIAQGNPEQISNDKNSITATYLKKELERSAAINKKRDITQNDIPEKKKRTSKKNI
jgi:excinuclease ABC subunit A